MSSHSDPQLLMAELLASLIDEREAEGEKVSRLLHDEIGQVLSAVGLQLDVMRMDSQERVPELRERTAEIQDLLEKAMAQVRDLSYELNPSIVERAGLQFALSRLVGRFRESHDGSVRLLYNSAIHIPPKVGRYIFKIAEQAIGNAVRHSGSKVVEILIRPVAGALVMEVRDTGSGFDVAAARRHPRGLGLLLMEHYASRGGLQLAVNSEPGRGTIIRVSYNTITESAAGSQTPPVVS